MGSFKSARSPIQGASRGHSRFHSLLLPLTWTHIGFMIASITARFRWTKIPKHVCSCFLMSQKRSSSSNSFALVSSRTCVFQGGIKMHDRTPREYRRRAPTSWFCWVGPVRRFSRWHHGSFDQGEIHSCFPQTWLPRLVQEHF